MAKRLFYAKCTHFPPHLIRVIVWIQGQSVGVTQWARTYNGDLRQSLQKGPGAAPGQRVRGLEAESFIAFVQPGPDELASLILNLLFAAKSSPILD